MLCLLLREASFCIIGTAMRGIKWEYEPEDLYQQWSHLAAGSLKLLDLHKEIASVQAYGYYFLCAVTMVPNNKDIFKNLIENDFLNQLATSLDRFWAKDAWHILNCLLLLKYLRSGRKSQNTHKKLTKPPQKHHPTHPGTT